jgi:hypothetical protein
VSNRDDQPTLPKHDCLRHFSCLNSLRAIKKLAPDFVPFQWEPIANVVIGGSKVATQDFADSIHDPRTMQLFDESSRRS